MKILILGATGAAGGSLLDLAQTSASITEVRTVSRRAIPVLSIRQTGYLHDNLLDYSPVGEVFTGVDACFFCVGRSTTQVKDEAKYRALAFDAPEVAASALRARSPAAVFHYLSGQGANLSSRHSWARIKAEAEQSLIERYSAVCWRPGAIDARRTEGWPVFYPVVIGALRIFAPSRRFYVTGEDLAAAMLRIASSKTRSRIFENPEIRQLADQYRADEKLNSPPFIAAN